MFTVGLGDSPDTITSPCLHKVTILFTTRLFTTRRRDFWKMIWSQEATSIYLLRIECRCLGSAISGGALRSENRQGLGDGTSVSGAAERHFHFFSRACRPHIFRLVRSLCEWFFEFSHKFMKGSKIPLIFSGSDCLLH